MEGVLLYVSKLSAVLYPAIELFDCSLPQDCWSSKMLPKGQLFSTNQGSHLIIELA